MKVCCTEILLPSSNGIDWTLEEFSKRIAQVHLKELPDYYTRLKKNGI